MKDKIIAKIEEKVDEIFFEMQKELGIESGDIDPYDLMTLYIEEDRLAATIVQVLGYQWYQKGE